MTDPTFLLDAIVEDRQRSGVYARTPGSDPGCEIMGIELQPLAAQYLFGCNVFPFQTTVGIAGESKANKSSLALWVVQQFLRHNGVCVYIDTEMKHAGELISTVLREDTNRVRHLLVDTLEKAHNSCTAAINIARERDTDYRTPLIIVLDSLYGALSEKETAQYDEEGSIGQQYPVEARLNSHFFKRIGKRLVAYPAALLVVNHYGKSMNGGYYLPGGERQIYLTSCYLRAKRLVEIDRVAEKGRVIRLEMMYSSIGPTPRAVDIEITWHFEDNEGAARQMMNFKWDDATAKLLYSQRNALKNVIDVDCSRNLYTSSTLGVTRVRSDTFVEALNEHPDLLQAIKVELGIRDFHVYRPDDEYIREYFSSINTSEL